MIMKSKGKEWWEVIFDKDYMDTYVDIITPTGTERQVKFLKRELKLKRNQKILDLGCGFGRHTIALAKAGLSMTGLDYSSYMLRLAKQEAQKDGVEDIEFIRADMRKIDFLEKFDIALSMFTSFGYFKDKKDDIRVLQGIERALKPGGIFFLDINNAYSAKKRLMQGKKTKSGFMASRHDILSNGLTVFTKEIYDPRHEVWKMEKVWQINGHKKRYGVVVKLFTLPVITTLLKENGFAIQKKWGNYKGDAFNKTSPRLLLLCKKIGSRGKSGAVSSR